jgi:tetratricopeptide (TPR) repeat protein
MRRPVALSFAILLTGAAVATRAQAPAPEPAYVVRGHQVEVRQQALKERLDRFHAQLSKLLPGEAPDLLPSVELPPPIAYGYQILPRIVPDTAPGPPPKPHVSSFSWPLSDTLISQEMTNLDRLDSDLAAASQKPVESRHAAYEAIVADYEKAVARRRLIDAGIDYNWLWQRQIADDRPLFDRLNARLNAQVDKLEQSPSPAPESETPAIDFGPPAFVQIDAPVGRVRTVTVPFYTDILDAAVVESFRRAIETYWHVFDGRDEYRVRLNVATISPERLYCGPTDVGKADGKAPAAACAPPAKGEHIDLDAHVARFPADVAVFTTGAASLQLTAGRAIALGPHDVAPRTLAHEFGHILGFPDGYLRGYQDLGADGFEVREMVADFEDIMASPGRGVVFPRHFKALIAAREIQALMQAGLDALYKQGNPAVAVAQFRQVLARNPDHYGATLQLAKALDRAGKPEEALPVWRKMLAMAEAAGDAETLQSVRTRLGDTRQ